MSDSKSFVNFSCQRCLQPLKLDESLNNLGEHTIADLTLQIRRNNEVDLDLQSSSLDHYVPPFRMSESGNGTNGFMVISDGWETTSLGHQLHVKATLFDLLSNNSDVDHPLCDECTDTLLELMDNQLRQTEAEWKDYNDYLKKLEDDKEDLNLEGLEKELDDWKQEQSRFLSLIILKYLCSVGIELLFFFLLFYLIPLRGVPCLVLGQINGLTLKSLNTFILQIVTRTLRFTKRRKSYERRDRSTGTRKRTT